MSLSESRFAGRLRKQLAELRNDRIAALASGHVQDFPDYRNRVGYLQALNDVDELLAEALKKTDDGDRTL